MQCLRRTDANKQIFERNIYLKQWLDRNIEKRRNFFNHVDITDNLVNCNGKGNYTIGKEFCENGKYCQSKIDGDIFWNGYMCDDFSFWQGEGRCYNRSYGGICTNPALFCNQSDCTCHPFNKKNCPNSSTENDCKGFFCHKSNSCVGKGKYFD